MTGADRRRFLVGGTLLAATALPFAIRERRTTVTPIRAKLASGIPARIGQWRSVAGDGSTVTPPERANGQLYDQEISKVFKPDEESSPFVMLVLAYGSTQSDTLKVHRPEFCYPAAGFALGEAEVLQQRFGSLAVPLVFFTAINGERVEHVLYWTRVGRHFPTSWLQQHGLRLGDAVRGIVPDGVLVRASVIGGGAAAARTYLASFLGQFAASISPVTREALLGRR